MAEVLGVVSGAIAVVDFAGRIATGLVALKHLWDDVKDIPEDVNALVGQIELLQPFLADMEAEFFRAQEGAVRDAGAANLGLEYCRQAVAKLESLVGDLRQQILSTRRLHRSFTRVRVSLKRDLLGSYRTRLQFILHLLSLSQQSYTIVMMRSQPSIIISEIRASIVDQRQEAEPPALEPPQHDAVSTKRAQGAAQESSFFSLKPMPFYQFNYLWRFSSRTDQVSHQITPDHHTTYQVYHARLQLPSWLVRKAWDLQAYRACDGWKFLLRPWNVRPRSAKIFEYVKMGRASCLYAELDSGRASIYDRDPDGLTLLHYAVRESGFGIFQNLMQMGLRADDTDLDGYTPDFYLRPEGCRDDHGVLNFYRLLISRGVLGHVLDDTFLYGKWTSLSRYILRIPHLIDLVAAELVPDSYQLSGLFFRFLDWYNVDPHVLLEILRRKSFASPADFRVQMAKSPWGSLHGFCAKYFFVAAWSYSALDKESEGSGFQHWRTIARWIFSDIPLQDLGNEPDWLQGRYTPLIIGLTSFYYTGYLYSPSRRSLSSAAEMWLEDLLASGTDLTSYGAHEAAFLKESGCINFLRWYRQIQGNTPMLSSITFGPRPCDWGFEWDPVVEDFAGEFWDMTDNPPLPIPGAWVDEDE